MSKRKANSPAGAPGAATVLSPTTGRSVEASGEINRAGGSLIFLRGMLNCGERKLFAFSGTIKRVKMRPLAAAVESNS